MQSLAARHPWRLDLPLLLAASLVLLVQGLTMPAIEIRALIFWRDQHSILSNIQSFHEDGKETAAVVLALCSVAYPAGKIVALFFLWLAPFPARWRSRFVRLLRLLGRWSMLDVFAVTAIVVGSSAIGLLEARPLPGVYVYASSIFTLMIATVLMDRLARHGR
ncbi:MAG: paraquat-inducible protein A [Planctomycetota bacterium]|jgi:paraquat-inducible protein A